MKLATVLQGDIFSDIAKKGTIVTQFSELRMKKNLKSIISFALFVLLVPEKQHCNSSLFFPFFRRDKFAGKYYR
jgi:hypothetical protein